MEELKAYLRAHAWRAIAENEYFMARQDGHTLNVKTGDNHVDFTFYNPNSEKILYTTVFHYDYAIRYITAFVNNEYF